jgi:hypothetical protein
MTNDNMDKTGNPRSAMDDRSICPTRSMDGANEDRTLVLAARKMTGFRP